MKFKRRLLIPVLLIIIGLLLAGCGKPSPEDLKSKARTSFIMGTMVTVKVYGPDRAEVAQEVLDELRRIENLMSINIDDSEMSKVNENAGIRPVKVSEDTFKVVQKAVEYADKTDGLFDPSIGPIVKLWGIGSNHAKLPSQAEIDALLPLVNYKNIILNEEEKTIFLKEPGMIIDVGGIAKGYAADQAMAIFKERGVKSGFINIGGNVMVHGDKPENKLWRIGIQDPRSPRGDLMAVVGLEDIAVVTSGDYERYIIRDDVRYHHILNPKTGYPVDSDLMSASIFGTSSMEADVLSTSVFLLGSKKGAALAKEMGYDTLLIKKDKKLFISQNIHDIVELQTEEYSQ